MDKPRNLTQKLICAHMVDGSIAAPGDDVALRIDQTLQQDATGTLVMLELEAMQLDRVRTEVSAQYVDHNLIQADYRNPDDHLFLEAACARFGIHFSRPGNGISHAVHMQRFGRPGRTLLGSDSHTPAAGALGMLAIGAGGLEVALAAAGEPYRLRMPQVWGVKLSGRLPDWVSAKDVILEMLRRHDVDGGVGKVIEYYGPGVATLSAMDRHVIANMGAELGATSSLFPADEAVREFMAGQGREAEFEPWAADAGCDYDLHEHIDLSALVPLIARPSSPGNVVPVSQVAGEPIYQAYIGSSANPGFRDFAIAAHMVNGRQVHAEVSFDVNPSSRAVLEELTQTGDLLKLIRAGARLHQAGCNGCIGMGQAPASGRNSLRTTPRNFPGRSGTREDAVFLCSPETAAASALTGRITDPRQLAADWAIPVPDIRMPTPRCRDEHNMLAPVQTAAAAAVANDPVPRGPNIVALPAFDGLPATLELPILLRVGDDISTDEIMPAGSRVLPFRSNIPAISAFCFDVVDEHYPRRARDTGDHAIVGSRNYGQGSSREHAALAPRYLGLRAVVAVSFARIHWQNLVNFGVLPLSFAEPADHERCSMGARLRLAGLDALRPGQMLEAQLDGRDIALRHQLSARQIEQLRSGGVINWMKRSLAA